MTSSLSQQAADKVNSAKRAEQAAAEVTRETLRIEYADILLAGDSGGSDRLAELMDRLGIDATSVHLDELAIENARRHQKWMADAENAQKERREADRKMAGDKFTAHRNDIYFQKTRAEKTSYADLCSSAESSLKQIKGERGQFFGEGLFLRDVEPDEVAKQARHERQLAATKAQLERCQTELNSCSVMLARDNCDSRDGYEALQKQRSDEHKKLTKQLEKLTSQSA